MITNLTKYKDDLKRLLELGAKMLSDLETLFKEASAKKSKALSDRRKKTPPAFASNYHRWYSESQALIRQLLPSRLSEFDVLYRSDPKRKKVDQLSYTIQDWLLGVRSNTNEHTAKKYFEDIGVVYMRFKNQLDILDSAQARFESALFDITQLVQADIFDDELDAAENLAKNGYHRSAGTLAGVVLERHLQQVCVNHAIVMVKKNPTLNDFIELLKANETIDIPTWRFLQHLGGLRNLCAHDKGREPSPDESNDLVAGVKKITKTLF